MHQISTSVEIDAPPDRVWDVLTAFRAYDEWNPTITRMRATLEAGTPVTFVINVGGRELKISAEMLNVEPGRELRWHGPPSRLLAQAVHGEHYLRVEEAGSGKSRLVHGEQFAGLLVPLLWRRLEPELEKAYGAMNRALKGRVEARTTASSVSSPR